MTPHGFRSAVCHLPKTFIKNSFSSHFRFLKIFRLTKMSFVLFPVAGKWFSSLMRIALGIFGAVNLMKF